MSRKTCFKTLIVVLLMTALLGSPAATFANTRTVEPGEVPFYARIEITDEVWVAAVFYRPPECVPVDFNLLDFYDFEQSWGCGPTTTEGFMLWEGEFDSSIGPIFSMLKGKGAVPIWFFHLTEFDDAAADGVVTIGELSSLPSLRQAFASAYQETLRPYPVAVTTTVMVEARGTLVDGRDFKLHFNVTEANYNAKITFGP